MQWDPDNLDGYTNNTGFNLTEQHQLGYNKFVANEARKRGLSVGLKNDLNQIEEYTFFEDINNQNFKMMIANKNIDLKYDILKNEIKETFVPENQVSIYKRFINLNDKVIEEKDADESIFVCTFSNYYEKINVKDKINIFFNNKYSNSDKIYNDVMELSCKDSSVSGEYYIFMAKDIGNIFFMRKDKIEDSVEESFSILDTQTNID